MIPASLRRLSVAAALLPAAVSLSSCQDPGGESPLPKDGAPLHVFLLIGDGMGRSSEIAASRYLTGEDGGLVWDGFPVKAWASTWDVTTYDYHAAAARTAAYDPATADPELGYDSARCGTEPWAPGTASDQITYLTVRATDSAAAATAMSTGEKTDAGNIAWERGDPRDGSLETIAERMRSERGAAIGIVSTVPFDHATPAAFVAHATGRGSYAEIAEEIITMTKPEVVVGGGHPDSLVTYFTAAALGDLRDSSDWMLVELAAGVDGGQALQAAAEAIPVGKGLFGLFGSRSDGAFEAQVPVGSMGSPSFTRGVEDPSLSEALVAAATVLARDPDGFFLMAEQGDIDWANHGNDASRMIGTVASLDEAVRAAMEFVDRPGDAVDWSNSLLVVTADHATGLPRLDAAGAAGVVGTVTYLTAGHGNELVRVAACGDRAAEVFGPLIGAGAGRTGTEIMDNTGIHQAIAGFAGLP